MTDSKNDEDEWQEGLITNHAPDEARSNVPMIIRDHPLLSLLVGLLAAISLAPLVIFTGIAISAISFGIGTVVFILAPVIVIPAAIFVALVWICYVAARWAAGLVFRGTVGSENRVMMRPQANASGNEAHGNLEINLVKVQHKEDGQPEQTS